MISPEEARCELCGEPMPPGEEVFKFHGYSGPCPKPPLPKAPPVPEPDFNTQHGVKLKEEDIGTVIPDDFIADISNRPKDEEPSFSHWNYRVIRRKEKGLPTDPNNKPHYYYGFYETYYDNGKPISCSKEPDVLTGHDYLSEDGNGLNSLKWIVEKLQEALKKPVLDYDNNLEEICHLD